MVLLCAHTYLYAQTPQETFKRNVVEVYFPVIHFFDGSTTNWMLVNLTRKRVYNPDSGKVYLKDVYRLPYTIGIQYTRYNRNNSAFRLTVTGYAKAYPHNEVYEPGDAIGRQIAIFSIGYLHPLIGNDRTMIEALGDLNLRVGSETYHVATPRWFEAVVHDQGLLDPGISAGLRASTILFWNVLFSGEARYTRIIYREDNGRPPAFEGDHGSSVNLLTLKLGLGYRF